MSPVHNCRVDAGSRIGESTLQVQSVQPMTEYQHHLFRTTTNLLRKNALKRRNGFYPIS